RVAGADDEHRLSGVLATVLAEDVIQAVRDLRPRRDLPNRGQPAVAEPPRRGVGARAVEDDVRLLVPLALRVTDEQAEWPFGSFGGLGLEQTRAANGDDLRFEFDVFNERGGHRERIEVSGGIVMTGDAVVVGGKLVLRILSLE